MKLRIEGRHCFEPKGKPASELQTRTRNTKLQLGTRQPVEPTVEKEIKIQRTTYRGDDGNIHNCPTNQARDYPHRHKGNSTKVMKRRVQNL